MFDRFVSTTDTTASADRLKYGFVPAIELRFQPNHHGELVAVNEEGTVIERWTLYDELSNKAVIDFMVDERVTVAEAFEQMAARLRNAGATVSVARGDAETLARYDSGGVDWV